MTEFPPNTHKQRQNPTEPVKRSEESEVAEQEAPRVAEKVVTGKVVVKKKSFGRKLKSVFIGDDSTSVWDYVMWDILVPAAKDTLSDAVSSGIEHILFGGARNRRPRARSYNRGPQTPQVYHNYQRYSTRTERDVPPWRTDSPPTRRRRSERHDLGDIILSTRVEAENVLNSLDDLVQRYDVVSVRDLLRLLGETPSYTDENWGWSDFSTARVIRSSGGYLLDLPAPSPLD